MAIRSLITNFSRRIKLGYGCAAIAPLAERAAVADRTGRVIGRVAIPA